MSTTARRVFLSVLAVFVLVSLLIACSTGAPTKSADQSKEVSKSQEAAKPAESAPKAAEKSEAPKPQAAAKDLKNVRLGMLGSASDSGLIIAMEKKYFEQEGLKVEVTPFDTAAKMIAPMGTGQLDVGGGALSAGLFNAVSRDVDLKVVADKGSFLKNHGFTVLVLRKDLFDSGNIKSLKDLSGKKVAIATLGASPHYTFLKSFEDAGGNAKDVEIVEMPHPDMIAALKQKAIDAAMITEPSAVLTEREGVGKRWKTGDELIPNSQNAVVLYSGPWASKDPDAAKAFMVAYVKGVRDYNDAFEKNKGKADIVSMLIKYTTLKDAPTYDQMITPGLNPNGKANKDDVARQQQWYVEKGLVKTPAPIDQLVDNQYADYAVSKLGEYK